MQRQVITAMMEACEACCLCKKYFGFAAEKKRKAIYIVAAVDARDTLDSLCQDETGQQLNMYIPELSDTGCQFLYYVCERQLLRVRKKVILYASSLHIFTHTFSAAIDIALLVL